MRKILLALTALAGLSLAQPADAQVALGNTGLEASITGTVASDYLFRGISQTRSRIATQANVELAHSSGFYIGGFISNVRFLGTDARQEVDLFGGYRFTVAGLKLDLGGIWYTYPGYDRPAGAYGLNYAEAQIKASYEIGPVNLLGQFNYSPNYFGSSGNGFYAEAGADWKTGIFELTLGGRIGYQWIERNVRFGTPDYAWWSVAISREFAIPGIGTITAAVGYYDTSIRRGDCAGGQDICAARALGSLSFKF
ncbi:TorF family putative porin [Sabulicella rubraurantiaca]|uniref:TorF family putative porin n=1 Tax=Sabulicella rubraurantiaca TaxID=2811429 RepID=UPI001A96AFC0|nr:TorF family putative porin [Sabulicella rubraurantiaca]